MSSSQEMANALLAAELHGLGPDYVRNYAVSIAEVTPAAAKASAARWLDGKNLIVVLVGNAQELEPHLVQAGLRYDKVAGGVAVTRSERDAAQKGPAAAVDPKKEAAARAVLDAALAAKGGARKLGAVKTLSWKGKGILNLPGGRVSAQVEKRFAAPDKLRLDMLIDTGAAKMSITTVLTGDKGWAQETRPDGVNTIDFPASEVEAGKAQVWRDQDFVLLRHREKGAHATPLEDVQRDGQPNHAILVTSPDGKRSVTLFIEKKKKRLSGMAYSEQGVSAEESYGDYKVVNGIDIAHQRTTKSAQVDLTTTVTSAAINPAIDPSIFAKPAGSAPPPGAKPGAAPAKPGATPAKPGPTPAKPGAAPAKPGGAAPAEGGAKSTR
jgi:hypothetical protein